MAHFKRLWWWKSNVPEPSKDAPLTNLNESNEWKTTSCGELKPPDSAYIERRKKFSSQDDRGGPSRGATSGRTTGIAQSTIGLCVQDSTGTNFP